LIDRSIDRSIEMKLLQFIIFKLEETQVKRSSENVYASFPILCNIKCI